MKQEIMDIAMLKNEKKIVVVKGEFKKRKRPQCSLKNMQSLIRKYLKRKNMI